MQEQKQERRVVLSGLNFPKDIMRELGLPEFTQEFTLRVKKGAIAEIECRYFPTKSLPCRPSAPMTADEEAQLEADLAAIEESIAAAECEHAANALAAAAAPAIPLLDEVIHEQSEV